MKVKINLFLVFLTAFLISCSSIQQKSASKNVSCNVQLGLSYLDAGDVVRAYHKLQLAVQEAPHNAESLNAMAYYYETLNEIELADKGYQRATHEAPSGQTHNNYGTFLCKQGEYEKAMVQFHLALEDKNYLAYKTYKNAGLCALLQNDDEVAMPLLKKALAYHPQDEFIRQALMKASRRTSS